MYPKDVEKALARLQLLVNEFISLDTWEKPIMGYIYYLIYMRVHPHTDGNGRIGRFVFFENPLLSYSLLECEKKDEFEDVFRYTNFPKTCCPYEFEDYNSLDEYFNMDFVNEKFVNKIVRILYCSRLYKFLTQTFKDIDVKKLSDITWSNKKIRQYKKTYKSLIDIINVKINIETHQNNLKLLNN